MLSRILRGALLLGTAAIAGALAGGAGFPARHIVEGAFTYVSVHGSPRRKLFRDRADHVRMVEMLRNAAGDQASLLRYSLKDFPCYTLWKNTAV